MDGEQDGREAGVAVPLDRVGDHGAAVTALGAKATNLVRALAAGLPVVPGSVLPVQWAAPYRDPLHPAHCARESRAGWYTSVVDVMGRAALDRATAQVIDSAGGWPMAVLAQPLVAARVSGVLFGLDPGTGEDKRVLWLPWPGCPTSWSRVRRRPPTSG